MQTLNTTQSLQILQTAPVGIVVLDSERTITWVNSQFRTYIGAAEGDLLRKNFNQATIGLMQRVVGQEGVYYVAADGKRPERWLQCRDESIEQGTAKYFIDVTELRRLQAQQERIASQLQELATIDPATGLYTTRAMMQNLDPLVSRSRRYGNPLSVVVMTVSRDLATGPKATSLMLAVGYMLKDQMRWADVICRSGVNEFVMVLPETSADAAQKLIDKIRTNLAGLSVTDAPELTGSIEAHYGLASWQKGDDAQQLLQRAHKAVE